MAARTARPPRFWLMKSEPGSYSIDDLARDGKTSWDGIRNYQVRNYMRDDMAVGDWALFYHSSATPPGVVGLARVASQAYPDETAFDPKSRYYDPKSKREDPRWLLVDVEFVERFDEVVTLEALKADPSLAAMMVVQKGMRLSVQPVEADHFEAVLRRAGARRGPSARRRKTG